MKARILIVLPEPSVHALLDSMLRALGHEIEQAPNDRVAVRRVERGGVDLVVAWADPDEPDALELLNFVRRKFARIPVILMFPKLNPERTREAVRYGASAVLRYPLSAVELRAAVTQALESFGDSTDEPAAVSRPPVVQARPEALPPLVADFAKHFAQAQPAPAPMTLESPRPDGSSLVGEDASFRQAVELASSMASSRNPLLIVGERGVGKSRLARKVHELGPWKDRAFIELGCGSLGSAQLERELLGHKTGGNGLDNGVYRPGALSLAQGGTIFLDEVASLSPHLQFQLLRVIRDSEFEPVGSTKAVRADVRIIMSNREDLSVLVEQNLFRQDLYYRLGGCLRLPPLRHRGFDVERLAEAFLARISETAGKRIVGFTPDALDRLRHHDWPGNVQELESLVQRAVNACQGGRITLNDLGLTQPIRDILPPQTTATLVPSAFPAAKQQERIRPLKEALEEPEKQLIIQALTALSWNRQETARVLDINRTTLYKKMKKYGLLIDEPAWVN
ncbi:sigma-54 dependent transcriptional regulator [Isosphaeraceae bacterium EP7]